MNSIQYKGATISTIAPGLIRVSYADSTLGASFTNLHAAKCFITRNLGCL